MSNKESKPIIETLINTSALTLTSYGVLQITLNHLIGYLSLLSGVGLEFFKYWGRKRDYW